MLKTAIILTTTTLLGLGTLPKPAVAQTCSQVERYAVREIQSNSPAIGSSNYLNFWTRQVPSYLSRLQQQHPNCNLYRSGTPSESARRNMQRWQNSIDDSVSESVRQEGITNMILTCGRYGGSYDRELNACTGID